MIMEGAPMVTDLDANGQDEVLTAAYENLIAINGDGQELWRFDTRGRYQTCPSILEIEGQIPLIYAADNTGQFTCLDGHGTVVWQVDINPVFCSSPSLADLNQDHSFEVVLGDKAGTVHVLEALTGKEIWKHKVEGECSSCAVGDLTGDGYLEIIVATGAGKVFMLDHTGELLWQFTLGASSPDWATASPVLLKDSLGKVRVVAASRAEKLFCLDCHGNVLWERRTHGAVASTISTGDIDQNGQPEILVVTQLGNLYRYDEDGGLLWEIDTQGRSLAPGAIIDIDGDGSLEYVLCTQNGNLLVFDQTGHVVFNYQFDSRTINMTPAFGDIVSERPGLEFAVTCGESGQFACFGIPAPTITQTQWRTYRGDNRLTGTWFESRTLNQLQMSPDNLTWNQIITGEAVIFRITNPCPDKQPLRTEASCCNPDGKRQSSVGKVTGKTGMLQLPVSVSAPGPYQFTWNITDASGITRFQESRVLTLQSYTNDQALVMRAVCTLQEILSDKSKSHRAAGFMSSLQNELLTLEEQSGRLKPLQTAAPDSAPEVIEKVNQQTTALNQRARRALALAQIARQVLAQDQEPQLIAFEGVTWENRDVDQQIPSVFESPLKISRRAVTGEHEPVSIKLLNIQPSTATTFVQVKTEPNGPIVKVLEAKPVKTNLNTTTWDPLAPLGADRISIPGLETREVWLDIDLKNIPPGTHQIVATFGEVPAVTTVEINLQVLPFEMAGPGAMRLCCWASYNEDAVRDLLAHGNTVFTASLPPVNVSEGNTPTLVVDFAELDRFVTPMKGYDVFLLMGGIPTLGVPVKDERYVSLFADYINQVIEHLTALGIGETQLALYPYDEPGGHGWDTVNDYITFARQGLKAHPGLKFYVNGGGDLPMFEAFNEITSIWCPGYSMLAENTSEMNFLRSTGKTLWSYDCAYTYSRPIGANTKSINVTGQYRLAPLFTFSFDATGLGYWCYNVGPSMWDPITDEYPLVYVNPDKSHTTSRRWEAVREGMEDTRILIALKNQLENPSLNNEGRSRIEHLIQQFLPGLAQQSLAEVRLGVARYVLDMTNNDSSVNSLRNEILDCVELVNQ